LLGLKILVQTGPSGFGQIYHLVKNSLCFKRKLDISTKIWLTMIPIVIVSVYSYLAFESNNGFTFDFYYGLIFVAATSVTFSFAILGALVFHYSILGTVWLLLVLGIMINSVGDVWYYYLETIDQYGNLEALKIHAVNSMWMVGYIIVAYALYKHRKQSKLGYIHVL
jgi:hypothetical protein